MKAFVISAVRSPIGKFLGGLAEVPAPKLGALVVAEAVRRAGVAEDAVEEVILGNVVQAGLGQNPARQAALGAGLPPGIAAVTINKVCGSGLKAVMLAAQAIRAGDADLLVAGGIENMSRAPFLLQGVRSGWKFGEQKAEDSLQRDGLVCPFEGWPMGEAAEYIARSCAVERSEQDRFAVQSHQRAAAAWERGDFTAEVLPITVGTGTQAVTISRDEGIRADTTTAALAKLRPVFRPDGTVTAGNASQLSDGAAAVVVASERAVDKHGLKPLAEIVGYQTSGVEPKAIFLAPVPAIRSLLRRTGLDLAAIDLLELNEAFAAQMLACGKELSVPEAKVNVNGGAIALGHPIGASGGRVLVTLVHALQRRNGVYGIASLCLGGGNAVALLLRNLG